jgi:hypothetical protein
VKNLRTKYGSLEILVEVSQVCYLKFLLFDPCSLPAGVIELITDNSCIKTSLIMSL